MVTFEDVQAAYDRLQGIAHRTPIMTSRTLNEEVGTEVFLKCENMQRVGAFKFRGAYNALSQLSEEDRARGVITYSSGNHAQAVALAGRLLDIATYVVMPFNAPITKRMATASYGAQVIEYDPLTGDRRRIAEELAAEHGYSIVPPYDHPDIIAGQGTAALELLEDVPDLALVLAPCGGGGLLSGTALAVKGFNPECRVIGIEPELADDATRSFRTGRLHVVQNPPTIADGTRTPSLGKLTFPLVLENVDDMQTVPEDMIVAAVKFLFYRTKLVVEPSGALGIAALLSGVVQNSGRIGVILSGGNVDGPTMSTILAR